MLVSFFLVIDFSNFLLISTRHHLPAHEYGQLSGTGVAPEKSGPNLRTLDLPKLRHLVTQPTGIAANMTLGRGCCILGVKTCQRCIEHLVFGLFDGGVGEFDCLSRMGFGSLGPFLRPVRLQIRLVLV